MMPDRRQVSPLDLGRVQAWGGRWNETNLGMAYEGVAAVLPEVAKELHGLCLMGMGLRGLALAGKMVH